MIPPSDVTAWSAIAPWATPDQVEQDLVLSRLMVEFARHPVLGPELTMRGGTCLHKLWLPRPYRYSEDLDYVRTTTGGVGHLIDAVREVAERVGFQDVRSRIAIHPKVVLRTTSSTGAALRVKVEMNTFERSPSWPPTTRRLQITSAWFTGTADVPTFALEELLATKIRALLQRAKGRDAFDLWLVARAFDVDPNDTAECFEPYRPEGWSPVRARANLAAKVRDDAYLEDLRPLVADWPDGFDGEATSASPRAENAAPPPAPPRPRATPPRSRRRGARPSPAHRRATARSAAPALPADRASRAHRASRTSLDVVVPYIAGTYDEHRFRVDHGEARIMAVTMGGEYTVDGWGRCGSRETRRDARRRATGPAERTDPLGRGGSAGRSAPSTPTPRAPRPHAT